MLSVHVIKSKDTTGLSKYYQDLAREDYYENGGEPPGYWAGGGAVALCLDGLVREGELLKGMRGFHPQTCQPLAQNAGVDHKPGWDCTFSCPKSVSACWAVTTSEMRQKIQEAQRQAVAAGLGYLQREAFYTRHAHAGVETRALDRGLVFACFEHSTSRNQDPQLHTHAIGLNLTPDGRGVDFNYSHVHSAGALYRSELAWQLHQIGFVIEREGDSFKIQGIPDKVINLWSSRRKEVLKEAAEHGVTTPHGMEVATLESRRMKQSVDRPALFDKWSRQGLEFEFTAERVNELATSGYQYAHLNIRSAEAVFAAEVDMRSTVSRPQVLRATAIEYVGQANAKTAEAMTQSVLDSEAAIKFHGQRHPEREYIKVGTRFTTQFQIDMELELVTRADNLAALSIYKTDNIGHSLDGLSDAQRVAVSYLTEGKDLVLMQGWAGAGKSYTLGATRDIWENAGYRVIGTSLSNLAARNLQEEAGITSRSVAKLTYDLDNGLDRIDSKTVVVVDEASMLSTRQALGLVQKCETAKSKLVLVGDYRQLQAIESGAPFRALCERIGNAELSEVRRQFDLNEREMARAFREGRAVDGLTYLHQHNRLHIVQNIDQAADRLAATYVVDLESRKSVLAVAGTRAEVRVLNQSIRRELRKRGRLPGDDQDRDVRVSTGWRRFCPGEEILFLKTHYFLDQESEKLRVINGDRGKILDLLADADGLAQIHVSLYRGGEISVNTEEYNKFDHGYSITVHKGQGQTVDCTHVLAGDMAHKEWGYVAMSRHRETVTVYSTEARMDVESFAPGYEFEMGEQQLVHDLERSQQKDMAIDYLELAL